MKNKTVTKYEGVWWRDRIGTFASEPKGDGVAIAKQLVGKYEGLVK